MTEEAHDMENIYTIENEILSVSVSDAGAQLQRIELKRSGEALLWKGNPAVWKEHSPWLFPVIGQLKEGRFLWQGKAYGMPMHGFAKRLYFTLEARTDTSLRFVLRDTPETLAVYPWRFELAIEYALNGARLDVTCRVANRSGETMYYSIGAHPGLTCREGDRLRFAGANHLTCRQLEKGSHLLKPDQATLPLDDSCLTLSASLFNNDALIFEEPGVTEITLLREQGASVRVCFDEVPWLGVWSRGEAYGELKYVCLEPWLGVDDTVDADGLIEHKTGIQSLEAGGESAFHVSIEAL